MINNAEIIDIMGDNMGMDQKRLFSFVNRKIELLYPKKHITWGFKITYIGLMVGSSNQSATALIWVIFITTSRRDRSLESWLIEGKSSPFMAARFR
jgi:hypothetical protein